MEVRYTIYNFHFNCLFFIFIYHLVNLLTDVRLLLGPALFMCPCGTATTVDPPEKHKVDCPARMLTLIRQNKELELSVREEHAVQTTALPTSTAPPTYYALQAPSISASESNVGSSTHDPHDVPVSNNETHGRPYVCNICGKQCDSKGFRRHILSHSQDRPHMCPECGDSFAQNSALQRHIMSHTGEKPFICEICGEGFKVNYHLKRHYMVHTGLRPYSCQDCGEKFSRNSHLKRHAMIHTGEKPFPCNQCGKKFLNSNHLKRHSMTHTGEKPYVCTECGEKFSRGSHLKRHLLSHSGEKPFKCDECNQMFVSLDSLRRHYLTHSGQKPFSCEVCGKRFMDSNHMRRHMTTHDVKPFVASPEKFQELQAYSSSPDKKPLALNVHSEDVKLFGAEAERKRFAHNMQSV